MKLKQMGRCIVDTAMVIFLFVLMAYHITGNKLHEWIGAVLFILFLFHHFLNWKWYKNLFNGRYSATRIFMVIINFLLLAAMAGMIISGVLLSREVFGFLGLRAGMFGRKLHMVSTAWSFCLIAVHCGLHFGAIAGRIKKILPQNRQIEILMQGIPVLLSCYGVYAFIVRQIPHRMFLQMEYAFFDYKEPAVFFFADYFSIFIFFTAVSYYFVKFLRKHSPGIPLCAKGGTKKENRKDA